MKLFAILSAFTLGCAVQATPLSLATGGDKTTLTKITFGTSKEDALNAALENGGLHSLVDKTALRTAATSPAPVSSIEKRQVIEPVLVFCSGLSCTGSCFAFTLIGDALNTCFLPTPDPFFSTFISNPSELELFFQVAVGAAGCAGLLIIPETNVCFNISPNGQSWAALSTGDTF